MRIILNAILVLIILSASAVGASELVLSENSLGPLKLDSKVLVSKEKLEILFPKYEVSYKIGQGDSPDFHYFEIKDSDGLLFTISSYIEEDNDENKKEVNISVLEIYSSKIKDKFGIKIGMKYSEISKLRKEQLIFGANHYDYHIGNDTIWYSLSEEAVNNKFGYLNPTEANINDIESIDPLIVSISWPYPRW